MKSERITSIDIIRGIALIGIFFVNVPQLLFPDPFYTLHYEGVNHLIRLFYDMFIQTKFYTIFAFLFGVGAYYFMHSVEKKGLSPQRYFNKRLIWLFVFGALHTTLLWFGDILHTYALIGFFLVFFYKRQTKTLVIWAILLYSFYFSFETMNHFMPVGDSSNHLYFTYLTSSTGEINFFHHYFTGVIERLQFLLFLLPAELSIYPFEFLPLFLLGMIMGRIGLFKHTHTYIKQIIRIQYVALLLAIPFLILMIIEYVYNQPPSAYYIYLSGKALAVVYVCTLLRALQSPYWKQKLSILSFLGRMAFTNYIFQSFITSVVVALIVKDTSTIPLWLQVIYVLVILTFQVLFSKWFLSRWNYGPLEYIWRRLTYGQSFIKLRNEKRQT